MSPGGGGGGSWSKKPNIVEVVYELNGNVFYSLYWILWQCGTVNVDCLSIYEYMYKQIDQSCQVWSQCPRVDSNKKS